MASQNEARNEHDRMLAGELYDCGDPALLARWHRAKDLTRAFAETASEDTARKEALLRKLLGGFGEGLWITPPFFVTTYRREHLLRRSSRSAPELHVS